jgi:hypothetical protein
VSRAVLRFNFSCCLDSKEPKKKVCFDNGDEEASLNMLLDLVKSQAVMVRQLNDTISNLKRTMETSHLNNDVKQELSEAKEEMMRLRQEVETFKNPRSPASGVWSKPNPDVYRAPLATSGETLTPRPLTMLKPVVKNTMSFRSYSAEDYSVVYVEISPSRLSQIRADLYAAGVDTKKVINISFINGRTAEFIVQTNYAKTFKTIIGKELHVHDRFDASRPMDPNAPESVVLAFKKSFLKRIQNIIANSSMAVVRQFYEKMGKEHGTLNLNGEKDLEVPEAKVVENNLSETRGEEQPEHESGNVNGLTSPREQDSVTSEQLRLLKVNLVKEPSYDEFLEDDYLENAQTSTKKGKEPAIVIDLEDELGESPKSNMKVFPAKQQDVEKLFDDDLSEDMNVENVSKNPKPRKLRRLFQKLEYSSSSSYSTETNEDENMDLRP